MAIKTKTFRSIEDVQAHIRSGIPSFYFASRTSTVIPYEKLEELFASCPDKEFSFCDLSTMPSQMNVLENGDLEISGAATWKDAKDFCFTKGRDILTSPTEELASVLSGVATSATGERCFGFGTLRQQVVSLEYLDCHGELKSLDSSQSLENNSVLDSYGASYIPYENFKNAPYPRFANQTDLLTGTEGQLGVITKVVLKTSPHIDISYVFIHLPKWEKNYAPHMEIYERVQNYRDKIFSCELIDQNALSVLDEADRPVGDKDVIFLEIGSQYFDQLYEELLSKFKLIKEEDIFEITPSKCRELRMAIPRETFERNAKMGVTKKGTDVQVTPDKFAELLELYKSWTDKGIEYNLFGHFGDAHLHFNFMPSSNQEEVCQQYLHELYQAVKLWKGSPFAEHGVGLIKQKFIHQYYGPEQFELFDMLKAKMDPNNIFFPQGFMNLSKEGISS